MKHAARLSLNAHLYEVSKVPDDLRQLILAISQAAKYIHFAIRTTEAGLSGSKNQFGEEQVKLDVLSDDIIRKHLSESRLVASIASEEQDSIIELGSGPYSVVYDPLDGSSLTDVNLAIGSIFGIYEGAELLGRKPREQVAALYVIYGPRTVLVYAAKNGVHEFLLNEVGEFILLKEFLGIGDKAKTFSPGNLSAVNDSKQYRAALDHWVKAGLTLRYSGCMAADVHHILSKGQGIFTNLGGKKYPEGKLRLLFECGPFAYLAEEAGGSSSDGDVSILDKTMKSLDERTPLIIGSSADVAEVCKMLGS